MYLLLLLLAWWARSHDLCEVRCDVTPFFALAFLTLAFFPISSFAAAYHVQVRSLYLSLFFAESRYAKLNLTFSVLFYPSLSMPTF